MNIEEQLKLRFMKLTEEELTDKGEYYKIVSISEKTLKNYEKMIKLNSKLIKESMENDTYEVYVEKVQKELLRTYSTHPFFKKMNEVNALETVDEIFQFLSNYYGIYHSKHFILDVEKIPEILRMQNAENENMGDLTLLTTNLNHDFSDVDFLTCGDIVVDFKVGKKFLPWCLKFLITDYSYHKGEVVSPVYNIALNACDKIDGREIIGNILNFSYVPALYPRIISEKQWNASCNNCEYRNEREIPLSLSDGKTCLHITHCMKGKNSKKECRLCQLRVGLTLSDGNRQIIDMRVDTLIAIIAHVCRIFKNRATITRKNGRSRKEYERSQLHIAHKKSETDSDSIVSLSQYVQEERKVKKEWQGGHHSSPNEHERRGYYRTYRNEDGSIRKIVPVRATIVNKGHNKVTYKI